MLRGAALVSLLLCGLYSGAYGSVRLTHVLVHFSLWTSEEGLNGHHSHFIAPPGPGGQPAWDRGRALQAVFAPMTTAEVFAHERRQQRTTM